MDCCLLEFSAFIASLLCRALNPRQYSNHLKSGLVWYSNGRFVSGCQLVLYSNGGLKTGLKKPVNGPKCPAFEWSAKSCDFTI